MRKGKITYLNESRLAFTGLDPDAAHSDSMGRVYPSG